MKHIFLPLTFSLLLFAGCSKDAPEAAKMVLDGEYQVGSTITTAPIKMYTKDGEVNNPALIDRFLSRRSWAASYFPRTDVPVPTTSSFKIIVRGNNQASLISTSSGRNDTVKTDITAQRTDYAVLTGRDSLTVLSGASGAGRCDVLIGQMEKEQPVKRCVPMSLATGYSRQCKFRPVRLLKISAGQLSIPQLSWMVQSGPMYNSCGYSASGAWNLFNSGIPSQLIAGDTVIVQERTIALVKK